MKKVARIALYLFITLIVALTSGLLYLRHCEWCPDKAAEYATEKAEKSLLGCALYMFACDYSGRNTIICGWRCVELQIRASNSQFPSGRQKVRTRGRGYCSLPTYWWSQIWAYRYMEWQAVGFGLQTTKPYSPQRLPQSGV